MNILDKALVNQIDTRLIKGDMSGILLRDVRWSVKTAGPSPLNNERTELFLLGCEKAMTGNPCEGCFNRTTWDKSNALWSHDPIKMAEHINNNAPNKYITIGGGEPTDQIQNLIILCRELKKYGFHIMMYTWKNLRQQLIIPQSMFIDPSYDYNKVWQDTYNNVANFKELLKYVDIIVDGEYNQMEHQWDGEKEDGLISSIGSGNQIIWDIKYKIGFAMRDIIALNIRNIDKDNPNDLQYILKQKHEELKLNF